MVIALLMRLLGLNFQLILPEINQSINNQKLSKNKNLLFFKLKPKEFVCLLRLNKGFL